MSDVRWIGASRTIADAGEAHEKAKAFGALPHRAAMTWQESGGPVRLTLFVDLDAAPQDHHSNRAD